MQRQTIAFETWDRYRDWAIHVQGATALLELRGQEQFTRERGAQLYVQIRSQIVNSSFLEIISATPVMLLNLTACSSWLAWNSKSPSLQLW